MATMMRIYLKDGYPWQPSHTGPTINAFGQMVYDRTGPAPFIHWAAPSELIPEGMRGFISNVTDLEYISNEPRRTKGEYLYRRSRAVLREGGTSANDRTFQLYIIAPSVEEVEEMRCLIRSGQLHPAVSYEAPMVPPPITNLRQRLKELGAIISRDFSNWWREQLRRTPSA